MWPMMMQYLKNILAMRQWQVSRKPCPHVLALITTCRNPNMDDLHPHYLDYLTSPDMGKSWIQSVATSRKEAA
jgi:hypothetical protein